MAWCARARRTERRVVQANSTDARVSALISEHMAREPPPQGLLALTDWIRALARAAYEAGRADRVDAAQELDQITGALADAPWRQRAQTNAAFDQACAEFDATHVRERIYCEEP